MKKHSNHALFSYEANVAGQDSLHESDLMISDWSGAALEYAFGLNKPVLFVDVPRKVNNLDYEELGIEPFEAEMREKIGIIMAGDKFSLERINLIKLPESNDKFYFQNSSKRAVDVLEAIIGQK